MKIFIAEPNGNLTLRNGKSIVVGFDNGNVLELAENPGSLLSEITDGLYIWGGRKPSEATTDLNILQLNITPVASNCIIITPYREAAASTNKMELFIAEDNGHLHPLNGKNVVLELDNGKNIEIMEDYANKGLLVWGGREPIQGLPPEKAKERTESLGLYPLGANIIHVFPFKLE
jgi:hypothetical protein